MAKLLLIETAGEVCSVGISEGNELIVKEEISEKNAHSKVINLLIEKLFKQSKLSFNVLDGVAISKGPGSYTGLRIGTATAKGICFAQDIPLISINSLQSLCQKFLLEYSIQRDTYLMPMFDARRMEVYTALYDYNLNELKPTTALVLNEITFKEWVENKSIILFGNGALKCDELIKNCNNVKHVSEIMPSVDSMVNLAYKSFINNNFEDIAYFEPFYLKEFLTTTPRKKLE